MDMPSTHSIKEPSPAKALRSGLLVLFLTTSALGGAALAQDTQEDSGQNSLQDGQQAPMKALQQYRQEIQKINEYLFEIQKSTLEANPEIARQREQLIERVDAEMQESGLAPQATRERIQSLRQQLQTGELSQEESQAVTQELRKAQGSLQQARQQAMQNEEIRQEQQELSENLVTAMIERQPDTEQLLVELQRARERYRSILQNAIQQQQQ